MKDQIQFETNGLTVLACRVPKDAYEFNFFPSDWQSEVSALEWKEPTQNIGSFIKNSGAHVFEDGSDYKIHAVTTELTEEQAKVLVEKMPWGEECYKNYVVEKVGFTQIKGLSPKKSLSTLFASHGIDPTEKWVLLVKSPE